jgi:hydrogenase maturation protease
MNEPVLIAGIGNIFLGDDGFGVAVAQQLLTRALPPGVRVVDFGIRSVDLAYALLDWTGTTILVDACPRGEAPGTLCVIDADDGGDDTAAPLDPHAMNPLAMLRLVRSMGGRLNRVLVLGCEPATLGPADGHLGLSDQVAAVVGRAADLALTLVQRIRQAA